MSVIRPFQVLFNLTPRCGYFGPVLGRGLSEFLKSLRNASHRNHALLMLAQRVVYLSEYTAQWIPC